MKKLIETLATFSLLALLLSGCGLIDANAPEPHGDGSGAGGGTSGGGGSGPPPPNTRTQVVTLEVNEAFVVTRTETE